MAATMPTTLTKRLPIESSRKAALVAGVFYLITFIASIPALFLLSPLLNNADYVVSSGADTRVIFGGFLELVTALAGIGTAVALYPVIKRQNEAFALGFVANRTFEAAVIVIGVVCILAVVSLRQDGGAAGTDAASMIAVGQALVSVREGTFLVGVAFVGCLNAVLLGYPLYRSRLVPRLIPAMGLIGAPLLLSAAIGMMFDLHEYGSAWSVIGTVPIFLWELSLGLWLVFKGFKPSRALAPDSQDQRMVPAYTTA